MRLIKLISTRVRRFHYLPNNVNINIRDLFNGKVHSVIQVKIFGLIWVDLTLYSFYNFNGNTVKLVNECPQCGKNNVKGNMCEDCNSVVW